jgi:hypothetical protein
MDPQLVTIVITDPWEFPDENEGRLGFVACIVGDANGKWLLHLKTPVNYQGRTWHFAIPTTRHVGQLGFEADTSANILFITDDQASDQSFLCTYDSEAKPSTPWVIGSVEIGISQIIPPGSDSYTEPRWTRRHR